MRQKIGRSEVPCAMFQGSDKSGCIRAGVLSKNSRGNNKPSNKWSPVVTINNGSFPVAMTTSLSVTTTSSHRHCRPVTLIVLRIFTLWIPAVRDRLKCLTGRVHFRFQPQPQTKSRLLQKYRYSQTSEMLG